MGQFSVTIYGATGSVLSDNQQSEALNLEKNRAMIKRDRPALSISQQCTPGRLSRSTRYDTPVGIDTDKLAMMNEIAPGLTQ